LFSFDAFQLQLQASAIIGSGFKKLKNLGLNFVKALDPFSSHGNGYKKRLIKREISLMPSDQDLNICS